MLRRHEGLTMMELLVTVVIAGVAFAAIVPVFVQAAQRTSADALRNVAANIAQEKMERIRQLDYDSITADQSTPTSTPNLYNPTWMAGAFGPTEIIVNGPGVSRMYHITYEVRTISSGSVEMYKQVAVKVTWDAPPKPMTVTLQTDIYRQYAGPVITTFEESPLQYVPGDPALGTDDSWYVLADPPSTPVSLKATIDANDIGTTSKVAFKILGSDGGTVVDVQVPKNSPLTSPAKYGGEVTYYNSTPGQYVVEWRPTAYRDGAYKFQAQAMSTGGYWGPLWPDARTLETGAPHAPEGLTAAPSETAVYLSWKPSLASDIAYYELYRRAEGEAAPGTEMSGNLPPATATAGYTDTGLTTGDVYYYSLRAIDDRGNVGAFCSEVRAVPNVSGDTQKPTAPTNVVATKTANMERVTITWAASTDNVGVFGYHIWRATSSSAPWPSGWSNVGQGSTTPPLGCDDLSVVWTQTYFYAVTAYDAANNESDPSAMSAPVTIDPQPPVPTYTVAVTVANNQASNAYVEIYDEDTHTSYGQQLARKNKSTTVAWNGVPAGAHYRLRVYQPLGTELTGKEQTFPVSGPTTLNQVNLP